MPAFLLAALAALSTALIGPTAPSRGGEGLGLGVSPVSLVIPPGERTTATTVSNPGSDAVTVQVRVFAWSSQGAEDVYTPTQAVSFSPAIFKLEPGQRQLVRFLLREPAVREEAAYRLVIDQLPAPSSSGGLRMPVRMLLPVFAQAQGADQPVRLRWEAVYAPAAHALTLTVHNQGSRHVRLADLAYRSGGARYEVRAGLAGYALAGQSRSWTVNASSAPQEVRVEAIDEAGPMLADVPVLSR